MMLLETGLAQVSGDRHRPAPRRAGGAGLAGLLATSAPPVRKRFTDGTHRREAPARTLARLLPRLPEFGITRVARLTGFDRTGIEVFAAVRPNARGAVGRQRQGRSTRAAAKVSAVMEAIERWHAERPRIAAALRRAGRPRRPRRGRSTSTPCPAAARAAPGPLAWAEATDLATGAPALVPFDLVHTCWLAGLPESPFFTSTNGLASGTPSRSRRRCTRLCELIEGDAVDAVRAAAAGGARRPAHRSRRPSTTPRSPALLAAPRRPRLRAGALGRDHRHRGRRPSLCALTDARGAALAGGLRLGLPPRPRRRGAPGDHRGGADPARSPSPARRDDLGPDLYAPGVARALPPRASRRRATRRPAPWAALPTAAARLPARRPARGRRRGDRGRLRPGARRRPLARAAARGGPPRRPRARAGGAGRRGARRGRAPRGRRRTSHDRRRLRRPEPRRRLRRAAAGRDAAPARRRPATSTAPPAPARG